MTPMALLPIELKDKTIFVQVKNSPLSKSIRLTIRHRNATLTAPPGVPLKVLQHFLLARKSWLEKHMTFSIPASFQYGQTITIFGLSYVLKQDLLRPKHINKEEGILWIGAPPDKLHSTLVTFLKKEAKNFFQENCQHHANKIGVSFQQLTIRDAKTRWGSCSSQGGLNFNWRLALAPPDVATYIAAHEVAHLKEMNHSPRFWKIVEHLDPSYQQSRAWIKKNGPTLMEYS